MINMAQTKRDSRYELLRIIAMLAIILNHTPISENALLVNEYVHNFFYLGGQFGVNLFVIIGSWFLCDSGFKSKGIIRIIAQMVFYSLVLDIVCLVLGYSFSLRSFGKSFSYWFSFGYVVMLILSPFLNRLPLKVKKITAVIGIIIATIITVVGIIDPDFILVRLFLKGLFIGPVWFCYILVTIAAIKQSILRIKIKPEVFLVGFLFTLVVMYVVLLITGNSSIREVHSPVCFFSALFMFEFVRRSKIRQSSIINKIATYAFGAYLFQSHQIFKTFLWEGLFRFSHVSEISVLYGFETILIILVILLCTGIIERVRDMIINDTCIGRLENYASNRIDEAVGAASSK